MSVMLQAQRAHFEESWLEQWIFSDLTVKLSVLACDCILEISLA